MKLLLVDDDLFLRDMYATKFEEAGHEVTTAEDGNACLNELAKAQYDCVLFDMVMPGMTGIELLEAAGKQGYTKTTSFIVLSNQSEDSDKKRATAAGAVGYIVKAESVPSGVVTTVEKLVNKSK